MRIVDYGVTTENKKQGHTLDFYAGIIEVIDMRSFTSIWYWIIVAVTWSSTSHWTLGVPFDSVTRARRHEGQAQLDLEALVRVNCNRLVHIMDVSGLLVVAGMACILSILAALGFWYKIEIAQAIFLLAGPLSIVALMSVRRARHIKSLQTAGIALRIQLGRQRLFNQIIGMVAIFITAFWGMWHNLSATVL